LHCATRYGLPGRTSGPRPRVGPHVLLVSLHAVSIGIPGIVIHAPKAGRLDVRSRRARIWACSSGVRTWRSAKLLRQFALARRCLSGPRVRLPVERCCPGEEVDIPSLCSYAHSGDGGGCCGPNLYTRHHRVRSSLVYVSIKSETFSRICRRSLCWLEDSWRCLQVWTMYRVLNVC
jgi:hypothetical protein